MRNTLDSMQIETALDKAEKRLKEAIEVAQRQVEATSSNVSPDLNRESEQQSEQEPKTLYGFAPERSRSSKIENSVDEIVDVDKKALLDNILGAEKIGADEPLRGLDFAERLTAEDLLDNKELLNGEFHSGYDSLNEIATVNRALKINKIQNLDIHLLNESEEYEIRSFNEGNIFDDETYEYEAEDILPTEFSFSSFDDEEDEIVPYGINEALLMGDVVPPDRIEEELTPELDVAATKQAAEEKKQEDIQLLTENAQKEAEELLRMAGEESVRMKQAAEAEVQKQIEERVEAAMAEAAERGYAQGFEKGQYEGFLDAENKVNLGMIEEAEAFHRELEKDIESFRKKKTAILSAQLNELTDIALSVAEKVIKISLKSSKDVVAKMIVAAAEDCRNKQWAKVYISHEDKAIAMNLEKELIDALNQISENVKVIVMEDEPSGTCIIESPDQIVDASVSVQMDNIRQLVDDNKL